MADKSEDSETNWNTSGVAGVQALLIPFDFQCHVFIVVKQTVLYANQDLTLCYIIILFRNYIVMYVFLC